MARVAGAVFVVAAGALDTGALALFLGTSSSAVFSLSSLDISSLPRFLPRVVVGFGADLVAAGFGAAFVAGAGFVARAVVLEVVGAARPLRVAVAAAG